MIEVATERRKARRGGVRRGRRWWGCPFCGHRITGRTCPECGATKVKPARGGGA